MPEEEIPCESCEDRKEEIEADGHHRVISCDPIPGKDGWCKIRYEWSKTRMLSAPLAALRRLCDRLFKNEAGGA